VPLGLLGMLALIAGVESFVVRQELHLTNPNTANWRYAGAASRKGIRQADILCLGTSLTKNGVLPLVVEERVGRPTGNLAVFGGPVPASYYLLEHALRSGARPKVLLLDSQDSPCSDDDPQSAAGVLWYHVREWPEILSLGECLDLAWSARDPSLFGALAALRVLPSSRARFEIQDSIRSALAGRSGSTFFNVATVLRNWRINKGAHVIAEGSAASFNELQLLGNAASPSDRPRRWCGNRLCDAYTDRLLDLADRHGIRVLWLLPPVGARVDQWRKDTGLDRFFERQARSIQAEHPHVIVVDGRSSAYPPRAFGDPIHLNRRGAIAYSQGLAEVVDHLLKAPSTMPAWVSLPAYQERPSPARVEDIDESSKAVVLRAASGTTRR
jgi:hypothetical protein